MRDTPWRPTLSRLGVLIGVLLVGVGSPAVAKKKKGPDPVQQDPMDTEANPQPLVNPTGTGTTGGSGSGGAASSGGGTTGSGGGAGTASGGAAGGSSSASGGSGGGGSTGSSTKLGRYMVSLKVGAAPCIYFSGGCGFLHQGLAGIEFAWAFTQSANAYLIVPPQVQFRANQGTLMVPVGIQYDIGLPVPNLYIYPRLSVGYAVAMAGAAGSVIADHFGVVIPEVGLKYVFSGRYHLGGELVSVPVLFNERSVVAHYRIALSFGVSF
ncbi:MAG: hypothetical protein JNM83_20490 [Myxococcales bacterium]|nr:hypothetical protein [Myxococcales bacterium]